MYSAPVSRRDAGTPRELSPRSVRLSPAEQEMARASGISDTQYAEGKLKMLRAKANGELQWIQSAGNLSQMIRRHAPGAGWPPARRWRARLERQAMTLHSTDRVCIDDPLFWSEFLKRLSHVDPEYDVEIIKSLCETFGIPAARVLAKMKAYMHYGNASTAKN
jgi:hypothetical protein